MIEIDLHLHTTRSDGTLTPVQLIDLVASRGLKIVAVTDHDTTSGLDEAFEAARAYPELAIIPGVEVSTDVDGGEVHILAYYIDTEDAAFQKQLGQFRAARYERGREMVAKLKMLGFPLEWEDVMRIAGDASVGRPHVARAMVAAGYVKDTQEAFDNYLGRNGPAYAERAKLTPEEAIELALDNGALPVLAHPGYVKDLEQVLPSLKRAGLVGMEVYYGSHDQAQRDRLMSLVRRCDLIPCGGSDYHANGHKGEVEPGSVGPPPETIEQLEALRPGRLVP